MINQRTALKAGAVLLATPVIFLAACGSNSPSTTGATSAGQDGGSPATGTPIELAGYGIVQSQILSFPELEAGAQAAVSAINAAGGVNGHPLKLTYCNDQLNPNQAAECARNIVSSKAVADVANLTLDASQAVPILAAAGIADIAPEPISPIEYTSNDVFLIDGGGLAGYGGAPAVLAKYAHVKTAMFLSSNLPVYSANKELVAQAASTVGITIKQNTEMAPNTTDQSVYINEIKQANVDAVILDMPESDLINFWNAARSLGLKIPVITDIGSATASAISAANGGANGTFLNSQMPVPNSNQPGMAQFRNDMNKYAPNVVQDGVSERAWASVELFAQVARTIKAPVTRQSVKQALSRVHDMKFLWLPSLSFDVPGPFKNYPRVTDPITYPVEIENGKFVALGPAIPLTPPN